jgi:hypothetical protein
MPGLPPLIPPFRFAAVEEDVFRGGYPKLRNLRFIKRLVAPLTPTCGMNLTCLIL